MPHSQRKKERRVQDYLKIIAYRKIIRFPEHTTTPHLTPLADWGASVVLSTVNEVH